MHPLLTPTTHAEIDIVARNLSESGYFPAATPAQLYARILLGTTLSLGITEILHGVNIDKGKLIVERVLLERVIARHGGEIRVIQSTDQVCEINFFRGGKITGQVLVSAQEVKAQIKELLYDWTVARGARQFYADLFGHKFYVRAELPIDATATLPLNGKGAQAVSAIMQQAGQNVTTADKLNTKPPVRPRTDAELDANLAALVSWQNTIDTLSVENPGDWDDHAQALGKLAISRSEQQELFTKFRAIGKGFGVEYNTQTGKFFLADIPQLAD